LPTRSRPSRDSGETVVGRFAKAIKAGVIWINTFNMFNAASPFGGYKQSGYGREMGKHALDLYTQIKSVWVDLSGKPIDWFGK